MKIKDLRKKSVAELEKEATKLRDAIAQTQVDKYVTEDKNVKKQRNQRKDLARVLTVMNEESKTEADTADDKKEDK